MSGLHCPRCSHDNVPGSKYCSECGSALPSSADVSSGGSVSASSGHHDEATITIGAIDASESVDAELAAQLDDLALGNAMLVVRRGTDTGASYLLDTDVVKAGRHPDNEIFLDDVTVSRRHAVFRRDGGSWEVADVGSLNGTYVNGSRVETVGLNRGDEVQIGKYKLVFMAGHVDR